MVDGDGSAVGFWVDPMALTAAQRTIAHNARHFRNKINIIDPA